jgi:hypothetical protein
MVMSDLLTTTEDTGRTLTTTITTRQVKIREELDSMAEGTTSCPRQITRVILLEVRTSKGRQVLVK